MRGDDQPSRCPPRGVWFGLILTAGLTGVLPAQEASPPDAAPRTADPLTLTAARVTRWVSPDGHYVHLLGDAALLQGVEGFRAREAVARIVDRSSPTERLYLVEVYVEGDVRASGATVPTRTGGQRAVFRTPQVQIRAYDATVIALPSPPRPAGILIRSGFASAQPVAPPARRRTAAGLNAQPEPVPDRAPPPGRAQPKRDPMVVPAQLVRNVPPDASSNANSNPSPDRDPAVPPPADPPVVPVVSPVQPAVAVQPPPVDLAPIEGPPPGGAPAVEVPALPPNPEDLPPGIEPLPTEPGTPATPPGAGAAQPPGAAATPLVPFIPGTQRITTIGPRSGRELMFRKLMTTPEGVDIYIARGGINLVMRTPQLGIMDIEADEAVIWRGPQREKGQSIQGPNGEWIDDPQKQPMEVYLQGNVIVRQDETKVAGKGDQRTMLAPRVYYDFLTDRFLAYDAEINIFAAGLLAPMKVKAPRVEQFHPLIKQPDGTFKPSPHPTIRADHAVTSGSRFANPGYRITNKSLDLTRSARPATDPLTGSQLAKPGDKNPPEDLVWTVDARQNFYWAGPFPVFYWPHFVAEIDDTEPPLRQIFFRTNNYFGQQLLTDWNGFRFINMKRPDWIDIWNLDLDYLSARTKTFPAIGMETGWFGQDFLADLSDPYHRQRPMLETFTKSYFGYFEIWGLRDYGTDVLGTGPAIITNGPPGAGMAGIQRSSTPSFTDFRGRFNIRHNQRFLPNDDEHQFQELRLQLEAGAWSDRYFLEEYYKRLHDTGLDHETLAYGIWQNDSQFADLWTEANLMNWQTETQWLPRADYYRLGDSLLSNRFTYYEHSGLDYAITHTDIMVNNPNLFAYMPFDPISNTTGVFSAGRFYTNHELDLPLKFFNAVRLVPYVQGQAVGWTDQLGGGPLGHLPTGPMGRIWGAAGSRAEITLWKKYPYVVSELMNVHGLNNKISFFADARAAWSNIRLNQIAVQDDLDNNTYEMVRRYFAITSFMGGLLPFPYDPRHLILRRMISPITGTTDVQASIDTVMLGVHQRLQTKRGPIGRRRIVDYMTLDASTTYFPDAARDNFGASWGQTQYNYQWYIGDRTSIVSSGWFEFWKLVGSNPVTNGFVTGYNPKGLNIITTGISLARPPRSNIYLGYTIIDTGPIKTSALNASLSYWLSPKWYGTLSASYDFGDAVLLGTVFSFTRIGADYLTTIGLSVDPQRMSYQVALQLTPRGTPAFRFGSNSATNTFDTRFAPTE